MDGYQGWLEEISRQVREIHDEIGEHADGHLNKEESIEVRTVIGKYAVDKVIEDKRRQRQEERKQWHEKMWVKVSIIVGICTTTLTAFLSIYNSFFGVSHPVRIH